MIYIKDQKQQQLFDPWDFLSPKRRKMLDRSWPGFFRDGILPELPVDKLAPFFHNGFGRPTKELYSVLGAMILQQTLDFTDEETVEQLSYNIQWHYALNITEESDSAKYISPKTLWNMRSIAVDNDLDSIMFEKTTSKLASIFSVNTDNQRIDSVHIKSNMRKLGRIGIFSKSINKFLVNLKRQHNDLFDTVCKDVTDKYLPEKALECFSMVKPSESQKTLSTVSADLFDLAQQFKDRPEVTSMHSYKQLERVLAEHCKIKPSGDENLVELKEPKEIPSDSLQNPSDPDATYSGHKGQGYQVQVMETYTDTEDRKDKDKALNLITHIQVEPAHNSDANALIPAIESSTKRNLGPKEVLADSLYGGDDNCQNAKEMGVDVVAPTMGTKNETKALLSDFDISKSGEVVSCPKGHSPIMTKRKKTRHCANFEIQHCSNCSCQDDCPVKKGKRFHSLRYTDKEMRIAKRRAYEQTDEFKAEYRWRAGVEATMSEYDRRTGVKRLRVRGLKAVRHSATLKAIGINLFRAVAVISAVMSLHSMCVQYYLWLRRRFIIFKEQFFGRTLSKLQKCSKILKNYNFVGYTAR